MADLEGSAPGGASRTERDNCQTGVRACACVWNLQSRTNGANSWIWREHFEGDKCEGVWGSQ